MTEGKVLALLAPQQLSTFSGFIYALEEALRKEWDLHIEPWTEDGGEWIAVLGTPAQARNAS